MNEFDKFIKNMDPKVLSKLQGFANTQEGQSLISKFNGMDKEALLNNISAMSDDEKNNLISKVSKDPDLINKIKGML
ncbi:MAG: hypothetical protein Q8882_02860 [Bacillota bacterium]|nr:hypothetical protein [Bacillota bacterium]